MENKEAFDKQQIETELITDNSDVHLAGTGMSNDLTKKVIGGAVGALVGTVAFALSDKKTAQSINRAVRGLGDVFKGASESFNGTLKKRAGSVKDVAEGFKNNVVKTAENIVENVAEDAKPSIKDAVEDTKIPLNQGVKVSDQTFQLFEERLVANTKQVKTSEVAIGKHVETHIAHISVPLEKERLVIEQTPVNTETPVAPGEAEFLEGELVRMAIYEQTAKIEKQAFVREQINVRKEVEYDTLEVEDRLRREELDLDVQGNNITDKAAQV